MTLKELSAKGGVVTVNVVPLMLILGAAINSHNGPDIETSVEMLFCDHERGDDDGQ